ncbi:VOC family protein [Candidatus Poribacteria bacterium]|nr:VOC family protein [Candidatus Poribacteria bacterium]MBT5535543.1 VOC family protein [Candidatus Poribacteria bacterium]MBT7097507.1 VOC family protein [Candidatus Poribacteria bacterium]MBT7809636.1 VOC family protein [Candidatus Poribacteria bacterium]
MLLAIEHANITVPDLDAAITFLTTAFPEFQVRGRGVSDTDAGPKQWVHLGTDAAYIAIEQNAKPSDSDRRPYRDNGVNHLGFVVDDVDGVIERLAAGGYRTGIPVEPHAHRKRAYFPDHSGAEYEFVEYYSDDPAERNASYPS